MDPAASTSDSASWLRQRLLLGLVLFSLCALVLVPMLERSLAGAAWGEMQQTLQVERADDRLDQIFARQMLSAVGFLSHGEEEHREKFLADRSTRLELERALLLEAREISPSLREAAHRYVLALNRWEASIRPHLEHPAAEPHLLLLSLEEKHQAVQQAEREVEELLAGHASRQQARLDLARRRGSQGVALMGLLAVLATVGLGLLGSRLRHTSEALSRELAERRQMEVELRTANEHARALADSNLFGFMVVNADNQVAEVNDYLLSSLGYTRQEWEAGVIPWERLVPPELQEFDRQMYARLRSGEKVPPYERRYLRRDGSEGWVLIRGLAVPGGEGKILLLGLDLSERVEARRALETRTREIEQRLREIEQLNRDLEQANRELATLGEIADRARKEAEAANRAKVDFLAAMSHDLRTPLNAISGYTDLLEVGVYGPLAAKQEEILRKIRRNQEHLLRLLNDVLHFAKLEAGRMEIRQADVRVLEAVLDVEALTRPQMELRGLQYQREILDPSLRVRGDAERINQVLANLVSNAIKFTSPGGSIRLQVEAEEESVLFHVQDTGRGIPEEKLERIFEPFVQLEEDAPDQERIHLGVGLGLAISRELARAMGGEITVQSRLGEGSTFSLRLLRGLRASSDPFRPEDPREAVASRDQSAPGPR